MTTEANALTSLSPSLEAVLQSFVGGGYAQDFECRPEYLYGQLVPAVVDASCVRERAASDLKVFHIPEVFAGSDEIFLGFGRPNAYLVVPDGAGGYQKFAGKSLKRAPSVVEDTRMFVQSGILIRFRNLPPSAAVRIREAMQRRGGIKYWTCVNACLTVLEDAGFASGGKPLSSRYFPYACLKSLIRDGLTYDGVPLDFDVIRTTPASLESYSRKIRVAEYFTFCRHADRRIGSAAKKSKLVRALNSMRPSHVVTTLIDADLRRHRVRNKPAPALPVDAVYPSDISLRVSKTSALGTLLRQVWSPHTLFEAVQSRVDINQYLPGTLKAFPKPNPSVVTRLKKWVLFSRPVIWLVRRGLARSWAPVGARSSRDIYSMMRTHTDETPNKYNLVVYANPDDPSESVFTVARLTPGRGKFVDWVMCKHVLMSGYAAFTKFAGEIWKDSEGVIHISPNSGTYQPTEEELRAMCAFFRAVFGASSFNGEQPVRVVAESLS